MKTFKGSPSPFFSVAPSLRAVNIWIYFSFHLFSIITNTFYLHWVRISSLLLPLNDGFGDIVDDEGSFQLSNEAGFTLIRSYHPCNRHWKRITVLRTTAIVLKHVETLGIQMASKQVISWNRMIRGHINLVICLN